MQLNDLLIFLMKFHLITACHTFALQIYDNIKVSLTIGPHYLRIANSIFFG